MGQVGWVHSGLGTRVGWDGGIEGREGGKRKEGTKGGMGKGRERRGGGREGRNEEGEVGNRGEEGVNQGNTKRISARMLKIQRIVFCEGN